MKIKSIKKIGTRQVYDIINVNKNHNFICNNLVVKNSEWAKKENRELRKKLAQIRTKHLLFILCFPLKVDRLERNYLESFTNYWIDLFARGTGAIYVKDRNPINDSWRLKDFTKLGSYTEFTSTADVREKLRKHPNFWAIIKFPKPSAALYAKYLVQREKNVYNDEDVMSNVSKDEIYKALLVLTLRDLMQNDLTLSMNRILLHIKNQYDVPITKDMINDVVEDSKQLISALRQKFNMNLSEIKD